MDPFASLTVTYLVGAAVSFALFGLLNRGGSIVAEYQKLNWAPFVLGLVLVGLETGFIYAYRAGWTVSTAAIVQSAFLGVALIFVGMLLYKEVITPTKVAGILICLVGLYFINK
jgi:drug/metabolite transporter (DMT)-like permease